MGSGMRIRMLCGYHVSSRSRSSGDRALASEAMSAGSNPAESATTKESLTRVNAGSEPFRIDRQTPPFAARLGNATGTDRDGRQEIWPYNYCCSAIVVSWTLARWSQSGTPLGFWGGSRQKVQQLIGLESLLTEIQAGLVAGGETAARAHSSAPLSSATLADGSMRTTDADAHVLRYALVDGYVTKRSPPRCGRRCLAV